MKAGWISIDRALLDHNIVGLLKHNGSTNHKVFVFWVWLLCNARFEDGEILANGKMVKVARGQYYGSLRFMSDKTGLSVKEIRNILKVLKMGTAINVEKGTGQTMITILKYNDYQRLDRKKGTGKKDDRGTGRAQQGHSKGTKYNKGNKDNNKEADLFEEEIEVKKTIKHFDDFWEIYPAKKGKLEAHRKYKIAVRDHTTEDLILKAVRKYAEKVTGTNYIKNPSTWLHQGCYEDEYDNSDGDSEEDIWLDRMNKFIDHAKWDEDRWGFPPDHRATEVPARILKQFNIGE